MASEMLSVLVTAVEYPKLSSWALSTTKQSVEAVPDPNAKLALDGENLGGMGGTGKCPETAFFNMENHGLHCHQGAAAIISTRRPLTFLSPF